jgi:hypothetical protein
MNCQVDFPQRMPFLACLRRKTPANPGEIVLAA